MVKKGKVKGEPKEEEEVVKEVPKKGVSVPLISELEDVDDEGKDLLAYLSLPRTIINVAAKFNISFSTSWAKLNIFVENGYVRKIKTMRGKALFQLDNRVIVNG